MVDILKLVKDTGLALDDVAKELFPTNSYPLKSLKRIIKGKADLSYTQLVKLASLLGISLSELFADSSWVYVGSQEATLTKNGYTAKLHFNKNGTLVSTLTDNKGFYVDKLITKAHITLSEYINLLDKTIK